MSQDQSKKFRVLIVCPGKSGSTSLFYTLKRSLPPTCTPIFEPESLESIDTKCSIDDSFITKILISRNINFLSDIPRLVEGIGSYFTHVILLVRDPRDILISTLLYTAPTKFIWKEDPSTIRKLISLLHEKEKNPSSHSLYSLITLIQTFPNFSAIEALFRMTVGFGKLKSIVVLKYEDYIQNKMNEISNYLGIPISNDHSVEEKHARVVRSGVSESWRQWFIDSDCEFFRPIFEPYMEFFGYDTNDWKLSETPCINPKFSSEYFLSLLRDKRISENLPEIQV